jgi:hypothetical protein
MPRQIRTNTQESLKRQESRRLSSKQTVGPMAEQVGDPISTKATDPGLKKRGDKVAMPGELAVQRQKSARLAEECLWISVGTFRVPRKGRWQVAGTLEFRGERSGQVKGVLRYRLNRIPEAESNGNFRGDFSGTPVLVLAMAGFTQSIFFRSSAVTYGGRFYFACECGRSCGKLFFPPGANRFACRRCHKLRYDSQRHECDWFYCPLATSTGVKKRDLKKYFHAIGNSVLRQLYGGS